MENLRREGRSEDQLFHVGNVMIDTLLHLLPATLGPERGGGIRVAAAAVRRRRAPPPPPTSTPPSGSASWWTASHDREEMEARLPDPSPDGEEAPGVRPAAAAAGGGVKLLPPLGYLEFVPSSPPAHAVHHGLGRDPGGNRPSSASLPDPPAPNTRAADHDRTRDQHPSSTAPRPAPGAGR